ncbi:MAG: hypothetical protein KIS73_20100 [Enhydrobacter sp.]|nr:hypothetical protein [Enhydrobacter sp.]
MAKATNLTPEQRIKRELAIRKAAEAPTIFFEEVSTFGIRNTVGIMTLDMAQFITADDAVISGKCTVAHLRFPVAAIPSLRNALDKIELQLKPVPQKMKN